MNPFFTNQYVFQENNLLISETSIDRGGKNPLLNRILKASPAFATFFILLMFEFITNGTMERINPVDIVRPLASFVIFVVIYKAFSIFLPTRVKLSERGFVQHNPQNTGIQGG